MARPSLGPSVGSGDKREFIVYTSTDHGNNSIRAKRSRIVVGVLGTIMLMIAIAKIYSRSGTSSQGHIELDQLFKAPEIQLAEESADSFMYQGLLSQKVVQLDSVKPLLDARGTANLAQVTAALQGDITGAPITLKGIPTKITITLPEDVTIRPPAVESSRTSKLLQKAAEKKRTGSAVAHRVSLVGRGQKDDEDASKWGYSATWGFSPSSWPGAAPPTECSESSQGAGRQASYFFVWGAIEGNALCRNGTAQSPINLVQSKAVGDTTLPVLSWLCGGKPCAGDGEIVYTNESKTQMTVGGVDYDLNTMVFHTPSEHTFDGKHYDMEVQFVHSAPGHKTMVLSLLMHTGSGAEGAGWASALADVVEPCHLSPDSDDCKLSGSPTRLSSSFEFKQVAVTMDPLLHHYYSYTGSLTTPPCTEGVTWIVVRKPMELSQDDWTTFAALQGKNNRPPQRLDGRKVFWV